jgi:hypothetical protein
MAHQPSLSSATSPKYPQRNPDANAPRQRVAISVQGMLNSPPGSNRPVMQGKYSSLKISLYTTLRHPLVGVWTRPRPPLPPSPTTTAHHPHHPPHYPTHYLGRTRNSNRLLSSTRPPLSMRGRYSILRTTRSVSPGSILPKHPYQHSQQSQHA